MGIFIVQLGLNELAEGVAAVVVVILGAGWGIIGAGGITRRAAIGRLCDGRRDLIVTYPSMPCARPRRDADGLALPVGDLGRASRDIRDVEPREDIGTR